MRVTSDRWAALLLAVAMLLPAADLVLRVDPFPPLHENRQLAELPALPRTREAIERYPEAFSRWFGDHFGFRSTLIRVNALFRVRALGVSPSSQVIVGKNGWMFYTGNGEIEGFRGISHADPSALTSDRLAFAAKQRWLAARGIQYLVVIAPNKSTTYPELLPAALNRVRPTTLTDELIDDLQRNSDVEVIDLRPVLREAKGTGVLFHPLDTHWTSLGAFHGAREMLRHVARRHPQVPVPALADYTVTTMRRRGGDLSGMAGTPEMLWDTAVAVAPTAGWRARLALPAARQFDPEEYEQDAPGLPRLLVYGDSFTFALRPFVSEGFRFARWVSRPWGETVGLDDLEAAVAQHHPDVIIEEFVERSVADRIASRR